MIFLEKKLNQSFILVAVARLEESDSEEEKSVEDDYSTEEEKHGSIISPNSQEKDEALKVYNTM